MTAIFYDYSGEHEEVNKTLGTGTSVNNVRLLPGQDVTTPSIECDFSSRPTYNYVYISGIILSTAGHTGAVRSGR